MIPASILIVEDEPVIALDIKQRLLKLGYEVVAIADCLEEALQAVEQHRPDMILMDIRLHGEVDGIETARQIRQRFRLPVIFLTAHADRVTLQRASTTEPFGYIVKPFENEDLIASIETCLSRYRAEQTVERALERERELNQLKSHFISVVSHEFRNPLSVILSSIDLLEDGEFYLSFKKKLTYWNRARNSIALMKQLLEDILIIGESESGKLKNNPTTINVSDICQTVLEELKSTQPNRHTLRFSETTEETTDQAKMSASVSLDPKLLRYILNNLLSNAIKYSPQGGEVHLALRYARNFLVLSVKDEGIGIPPTNQTQLFDTFYRGGNIGTTPGTGLGLSIVKQCVEVQGGTIQFESQLGIGTTFTVLLPYAPMPNSPQ